ncbi:hypothetical protein G6F68_019200 [Rhizopus microsporus]|nr:hypothetical protein G6F68_019200 [Rhizopus microsporus]
MQQHGLEAGQDANGVHGGHLGLVQFGRLVGLGRRARRLALAVVPPRQRPTRRPFALIRCGIAQGWRQGRQHYLAQGPLVVLRGKPRQAQPVLV